MFLGAWRGSLSILILIPALGRWKVISAVIQYLSESCHCKEGKKGIVKCFNTWKFSNIEQAIKEAVTKGLDMYLC